MMAIRIAFTLVAAALMVWLLTTGRPLGGLIIVPALAIWLRHAAETGRLARFTQRFSS